MDQGVTLLAATDLQRPLPESIIDARPLANDHSRPAAANAGADVPAPVVDEFYNAARKVSHPDAKG